MPFSFFPSTSVPPTENEALIEDVKKEFRRIDNDWLHLHFRILVGLVFFTFAVELIMAFVLIPTNVVGTTTSRYILKFIITPSGLNMLILLAGYLILRAKRYTQNFKMYAISLLFVLTATVLFTVHSMFSATFIFFIFAIMLTNTYANYTLTTVTALVSLVLMIVSELFITWDLDKVNALESSQRLGDFLISVFILIAVFIVSVVEIIYNQKKNEAGLHQELERQMLRQKLAVDDLTGVYSRRALHDVMRDLATQKKDGTYIFGIADIDHFKQINDKYGHGVGDEYLIKFARILTKQCGDAVFRFGGDEFCLFFKNQTKEDVLSKCERVQKELLALEIEKHPELKHTASFGLTRYKDNMNTAELFIKADRALYRAKQKRNAILFS